MYKFDLMNIVDMYLSNQSKFLNKENWKIPILSSTDLYSDSTSTKSSTTHLYSSSLC